VDGWWCVGFDFEGMFFMLMKDMIIVIIIMGDGFSVEECVVMK